MGQFTHGGVNELLVGLRCPFDSPPFHGQEGGKDYLQNKILGFIIFLAFGENFGAEG